MTKPIAMLAMLCPAAAGAAPHDPGGDRIETFLWTNQFARPDEPTRHCTQDRVWCAELSFLQAEQAYEIRVIARRTSRVSAERRWRYVIPVSRCCAGPGGGISLWAEIVRDSWDGALVGVEIWRATGTRPDFFSNQRRLLLLHIPSVAGAAPSEVLETPLSGHIEQPMCPYPTFPPGPTPTPAQSQTRLAGELSDEDRVRIGACQDRFEYSTLFTLLPSSQPVDQPPDLIVATVAATSPGRRPRTTPGTQRAPIPRTEGDVVRDPACTFTRTYYFDAAQGRYVPDAPLPACPDYLEP